MSRSRVVNLANFDQFTAINLLSDPGHIGGPVVIPNAAKLVIRWNLTDGKVANNIVGMNVPAGWAATVAEAEAARGGLVAGANWSALAAFLAPGTQLAGVDLIDIRTAQLPKVSSTGAVTPGTSAGAALPSEVAAVITLRTSKTGPGNRGRLYIPGWAANAIGAGDVIIAGAVTALTNFITNIGSAITLAGGSGWCLLQPQRAAYVGVTGTSHPARTATSAPVTPVVRDNHWDTQRRRGLK